MTRLFKGLPAGRAEESEEEEEEVAAALTLVLVDDLVRKKRSLSLRYVDDDFDSVLDASGGGSADAADATAAPDSPFPDGDKVQT